MKTKRKGIKRLVTLTVFIMQIITAGYAQSTSAEKMQPMNNKSNEFFDVLFKNNPGKFDSIIKYRKDWKVQVIYTQINRDKDNNPTFLHHYYNQDDSLYFYPASAVKLPVAILALQKLRTLGKPEITRNTTMTTDAAYSGQSASYNAPNTADGRPTIAGYLKEMLLVSDNEAYNRLYEFLGQQYINDELHAKGFKDARILHRLGRTLTDDENRHTNPISFFGERKQLIYTQQMQVNEKKYEARNDLLGKGYYDDTTYISAPMNFSGKNRISLKSLHNILTSLLFPEQVKATERFNITEDDRRFILKYMSSFPGESLYPYYDSTYQDAYGKFIFYGAEKGKRPKNIRIFNKPGEAYGQLTDVAYVVDFDKKSEFMVSATIYCNSDEIINDDEYDYESIGLPFLKDLGKALYEYELKRKRKILPDLSPMIFTYDK